MEEKKKYLVLNDSYLKREFSEEMFATLPAAEAVAKEYSSQNKGMKFFILESNMYFEEGKSYFTPEYLVKTMSVSWSMPDTAPTRPPRPIATAIAGAINAYQGGGGFGGTGAIAPGTVVGRGINVRDDVWGDMETRAINPIPATYQTYNYTTNWDEFDTPTPTRQARETQAREAQRAYYGAVTVGGSRAAAEEAARRDAQRRERLTAMTEAYISAGLRNRPPARGPQPDTTPIMPL